MFRITKFICGYKNAEVNDICHLSSVHCSVNRTQMWARCYIHCIHQFFKILKNINFKIQYDIYEPSLDLWSILLCSSLTPAKEGIVLAVSVRVTVVVVVWRLNVPHNTLYRWFLGRFYRPDDQTNSVKALKEIRPSWWSRSGLNPTTTTTPCYNNTTLGNRLYAQRKGPNVTNPICWTCKNCSHKCAADWEHCVTQSAEKLKH